MTNDTNIHIRVNKEDKDMAQQILSDLGTNISSVVNMLLKQIIQKKGIPFDVELSEESDSIKYVKATMALEGMELTEEEVQTLRDIEAGKITSEEVIEELNRRYKDD